MVYLVEITSPKRVARSDPERGKEVAPSRKSSSMPGAGVLLKGRGNAQGKAAADFGTALPHAAAHTRPRSNAGIRIQSPKSGAEHASKTPAATAAKPLPDSQRRNDLAAQGILKMLGQPKQHVDEARKSADENRAAMQGLAENLQAMLQQRDAALSAQATLRMQLGHLDGHAEPERYESWAHAASVNLEAVFQEAEAAVSSMQARLDAPVESGSESDADEYLDAQSDWSADTDTESATKTANPTDAKTEIGPQHRQEVPVKSGDAPVHAEPAHLPEVETSVLKRSESVRTDHAAAVESPAELALREADRSRNDMAMDLQALNRLHMGYHTSGVLGLVENVRAMHRKIQNLEDVLSAKDEMLQGHADLVEQLADETLSTRLDSRQIKEWRAAAAMNPAAKFSELAASISSIKARMRNGVEHLTRIEGYSTAEIFPKGR